MTLINL